MDLSRIKDIKDLQALLELMGEYGLAELEISGDGRSVRLRKVEAPAPGREVFVSAAPALPASSAPERAAPAGVAPAGSGADGNNLPPNVHEVLSPLVGSFYRAPSPEAEPFVTEGDRVEGDTVLCVIEAMKVMNEIPAGVAGIVRESLVKNGEAVEYGQPLFRVEVE